MKTTTIFDAYEQASYEIRQRMQSYPARHSQKYFILLRQKTTFARALERRLEAGDRAREALKQVEWINSDFDIATGEPWNNVCPWCREYQDEGHAPDCPRQIALGLEP